MPVWEPLLHPETDTPAGSTRTGGARAPSKIILFYANIHSQAYWDVVILHDMEITLLKTNTQTRSSL